MFFTPRGRGEVSSEGGGWERGRRFGPRSSRGGCAEAGAAVEEDALHGGGRTVGEGTDGLAAKGRRRAKKGAGRVGILRACACAIGTSLGPRMEVIAWAVNKETGRLPLGVRPLLS